MGYTPPQLEVRKITGGYQILPPNNTSTDDLTISANGTDTYAKLILEGLGDVKIYYAGTAVGVKIFADLDEIFRFWTAGTHPYITALQDGKDLHLQTTGTGVLAFGTHTAGGDVACNGYITIKDIGGTTRKLMTTA